jgi:murein DD-endopeptidase MepM/ murein hydrolase activator NlpD
MFLFFRIFRRAIVPLLAIVLLLLLVPQIRRVPGYASLLARQAPDSLPVPVAGIRPSQLADTWGAPRSGGRHHEGIDIFAPRFTPIVSATEGIVSAKGTNGLGGRFVTVTGPGGYNHYYAHMERFGAHAPGDWVARGDTLGYVGDSGNAKGTPTHLHYGIYKLSGGAVNPYPFLVKRSRPARRSHSTHGSASSDR